MASNRKRRYCGIDNSTRQHYSKKPKLGTEEARWSRDQEKQVRRTCHQWEHDSRGGSRKRRRIDERGGVRKEEDKKSTYQPLGYKALEDICKSNSPEDGILDLANKSRRFEALLNSKTEIRPDLMKLIIHAVNLCCSSIGVIEHTDHILRLVMKTNFIRLHLSSFISQISFNSELSDTFQPENVILQLAEAFLELLQRFGREIVDTIPLAQLSEALEELKNKRPLHDGDKLDQKVRRVKELREEIIRRKIESARKQEDESELVPPQDFREVSVIPQAADLINHCKPFLRVNVVGGSYKDLEHYLDVQFRLLREDFILPLREGIRHLQKSYGRLGASSSRGSKNAKVVYVYQKVTVLYPVCNGKGMVYRIRFDPLHGSVRRVKWENSKRLKFGSLLCLSSDEFYTLLFATVENRDTRELRRGELEVRFEEVELGRLNQCIREKETFDMVESSAFFEAYRHVLEGLKEIQSDELPFQEHIVKCVQKVGPPAYEKKTNGFFIMSDIIEDSEPHGWAPVDDVMPEDDAITLDDDLASVKSDSFSDDSSVADEPPEGLENIYDLQPNRESLGFNESQMRAFKMALSKKVAVIQGPPGTGKTYVGQKIARVLLQSASLWQDDGKPSPILMVSYTNHALDEFLGGLPVKGKIIYDYSYYCISE